jgi:hypothetical protein
MARISVRHEPHIFIIAVVGDLSFEEIIETKRQYYAAELPCNVLWDFTLGSLDSITLEQIRKVALVAKSVVRRRDGGRTAYVGGQEVVFCVACMYAALAALAEIPVEYSVFKTTAEALAWFGDRHEFGEAEVRGAHNAGAPLPLRVQASAYSQIGTNLKQRLSTVSIPTILSQNSFSPDWPKSPTSSPKSVASLLLSLRRRMGLAVP